MMTKNKNDFQNVNEIKRKKNIYIDDHFLQNQTKIKNETHMELDSNKTEIFFRLDFIVYVNNQIMETLNDGKNVISDINQHRTTKQNHFFNVELENKNNVRNETTFR